MSGTGAKRPLPATLKDFRYLQFFTRLAQFLVARIGAFAFPDRAGLCKGSY